MGQNICRVPVRVAGAGYAFEEFARRHGDFAMISVAVSLKVDSGLIVYARIAIGGAGAVPQRAESLEKGLIGQRPDEDALAEAMNSLDDVECIGDIHASAEYRRHLLISLTRRAITRAALQTVGEL